MSPMSPAATTAAQEIEKQLKSGEIKVPMLPEVARKVLELANDPDSDVSQLAKVIQGDQTLAAHVLRISNSPVYSPQGNIVSLQQAISRLGMQLMSEIALAASINVNMFDAPQYLKRITGIWNQALATGLWAKEIARIGRRNVEAAFLCGLLHSIGRPVILQLVSKQAELPEDDAVAIEESYFLDANRAVGDAWKLPALVRDNICAFTQPIDQMTDLGLLIRAGQLFAEWMEGDMREAPNSTQEAADIFAKLNLYPDDVDQLMDQADLIKLSRDAMRA